MESPALSSQQKRSIIVWFDNLALTATVNGQKKKTELEHIIDTVIIFDAVNKCVDYINNINDVKILLIVDEVGGASVVRRLLDFSKIKSLYILCSDRSTHAPWTTGCKQVNYIFTDISSICEQIEMSIRDNSIGFNITDASFISSITIEVNNKEDVMFMYGQLLKHVLTEIDYAADDMDNMLEFFKSKYKDQLKTIEDIEEFKNDYASQKPISWYSKYTFLYNTLNSALRTHDVSALWIMRFFIKDLHQQIVQLHKDTTETKTEKIYRGQVIPTSEFEKIKINKGKLLSIHNFLSASSIKHVAVMFATGTRQDHTSVLFVISINQSIISNVYYANIQPWNQHNDEEEYLFTMGSVFRIESIEKPDENDIWFVHLTLTADHDSQITLLAMSILPQRTNVDLISLCMVMFFMGEYEKVLEIGETAIITSNDASNLYGLHQMLGSAHLAMGHYQQALKQFELASDYYRRLSGNTDECISHSWAKALVFLSEGKLDLAIENLKAAVSNKYQYHIIEESAEVLVGRYITLGLIFYRQGRISDALSNQRKELNIAKERLPPTHPFIGECLDQIATSYILENQMDDALLCLQESIEIEQRPTSLKHLEPIYFQGTFAPLQYLKSDRSISQSYFDCLSTIQQKWQSDPRQNLMKLFIQGKSYMTQGKIDEALSTMNQYITIQRENLFFQHPDLAIAHFIIGNCHQRKHDLPEALQNLEQGYEIAVQHYGRTYAFKFFCLLGIASVYAEQNNYDDALTTFEQCQDLTTNELNNLTKYFGIDPLKAIIAQFRARAFEHSEREEYEEALLRFQNCLKIQMQFLSSNHLDLGTTYKDMADVFKYACKDSDALINYLNAQEIWQKCLPDNDPKLAENWKDLGIIYCFLGQYDDALFAYKKCLQTQLSFLPSDHLDLADTYYLIGKTLRIQMNYSDALDNHQRVLNIRPKHLSTTDPKVADSWVEIGLSYFEMKQYDNSVSAFNNALDIQLNTLPSNHIDMAATYRIIALTYYETGKYDDALIYFRKSLDIQLKHLPSMDLEIAKSWMQLGSLYDLLNRYDESLTAYNQCLKIQLSALPAGHIDISTTYRDIASVYFKEKKYEDALSNFRKCLDIQTNSLSVDHPDLANTLESIVDILVEQKNFSDTLINCQRALDIRLKHASSTDPNIANSWVQIGILYTRMKQYDNSLSALNKALEIQSNVMPPNHIYIVAIYNLIACIYDDEEKYDDALIYFQKSLNIQKGSLSEDHPDIADTYKRIGDALFKQKNYSDSLDNYQRFLDIQLKHLPPMDLEIAKIWQRLGRICDLLDRYDESLTAYNQCLKIQLSALPAEHIDISITYRDIACIYFKEKKYKDALLSSEKCLDIQIASLPPDHLDLADTYLELGKALFMQKKYSDSLDNYQRVLDIQLKHLPPMDLEIAKTWTYLGIVYTRLNRYDESLTAHNQCLKIQLGTLPAEHIGISKTYKSIASVCFLTEKCADALLSLGKCLDIQIASLPPDHLDLADTYLELGEALFEQKKYSDSLDNYQRVLDIQLKHLPPMDLKIAETWKQCGNVYSELTRYDESLTAYNQCLKIQLSALPAEHIDISKTYGSIASVHFKEKKHEDALSNFRKYLNIQTMSFSSDHLDIANNSINNPALSSTTVCPKTIVPQSNKNSIENPGLSSQQNRFIIVWFDNLALTATDNGQKKKTT